VGVLIDFSLAGWSGMFEAGRVASLTLVSRAELIRPGEWTPAIA